MQDDRYFSRSWATLTREKGWYKPLLVMAVATLVPVAGFLGVSGYMAEWAQLTAWGADTSPKRHDLHVGQLISTGWRVFCASILWYLAWLLAVTGVQGLLYLLLGPFGTALGQGLTGVGSLFYAMVVNVAIMRAVIYGKATAALNPSRAFEMVRRDPNGLFKIVLIPFLGSLIACALVVVMYLVILLLISGDIYAIALAVARGRTASVDMGSLIASIVLKSLVPALVFGYATSVVSAAIGLLTMNSVGLWFRQFNVPAWGGPDDPLPPAQPVLLPVGGYYQQPAQQPVAAQQPAAYQQPVAQQPQAASAPQVAPVAPAPVPQPAPPAPAPQQPTTEVQQAPAPQQIPAAPAPVVAPAPVQQPAQQPPVSESQPDESVPVLVEPRPAAPNPSSEPATPLGEPGQDA